mgnify:CR=1 FL=1
MARRRKIFIYILLAVLAAITFLFIYNYRKKIGKIISPFLMAVIVAYLINPAVAKLEKRNIKKRAAVLFIYAGFAMILTVTTVFIAPEFVNSARELANTLPEIVSDYQKMFTRFTSSIQSSDWSSDIKNAIFAEVRSGATSIQVYVSGFLKKAIGVLIGTASIFVDLLLAMVIAYYLIIDANFFRNTALSLIPGKWRNELIATGREINGVISNFIQGQLLTALIVGVIETLGLLVLNVKYSFVLGLIGGIANIIPYFGPFIGAIPAVGVALLDSPMKALWTVLMFVVVQQIDNNFISPKIIEGRVGLHPVTTIIAILTGGQFFGILGMIFAVPFTAILKIILKKLVNAIATGA